ncbi:MAG: aminoglycoside phosphotransferase family protein [Gemmatimonadota bacterium]
MRLPIPQQLMASCRHAPDRIAWLEQLPGLVAEILYHWALTLDEATVYDGTCAWVAPVLRHDGSRAVLKLGMPHMEAEHEVQGLRCWDGNLTVRLFEADDAAGAMLIERCVPGTMLREIPEAEQDIIIAALLRRLWRVVLSPHRFRPLSAMVEYWMAETRADESRWTDAGLVQAGLGAFAELIQPGRDVRLLATDLHAGNVLRAEREPWLVIDPKPFVGDPAYDATQHLFNCPARMRADPMGTIQRFADLLEVDPDRVRQWTFARAAAEPAGDWGAPQRLELARRLKL